jgi:chromosomal replication initiator protein
MSLRIACENLWRVTLGVDGNRCEKDLGTEVVQQWLPKLIHFDAANVYLEASDSFQTSWFEEHVRPRLAGFVNNNQRPIKVHISATKGAPAKKEEPRQLQFTPSPLDPDMTLDAYLCPQENQVGYQLLQAPSPFNPIFFYGPHGAGKTHLLMGAAIAMQKQGKRVFFVKAETFTEHVVQAMRFGQMQNFRKVYRDIDALIVDDIHLLARKTATQEEFFHTFNTLHTSGRPILLSANVPPMQLSEIEPRLVSRFEWGISLKVAPGDLKAILEKKAACWKLEIPEDIFLFLLERFPSAPVMALQALALRAKGKPLSRLLAEQLLKDLLAKEEGKSLTCEKIVKAVAAHYGITSEDLLGKSQTREIALARQVAMYLCREKLQLPYQKIGEAFSRDHSTVMSSIKQIQKGIEEKKADLLDALRLI